MSPYQYIGREPFVCPLRENFSLLGFYIINME